MKGSLTTSGNRIPGSAWAVQWLAMVADCLLPNLRNLPRGLLRFARTKPLGAVSMILVIMFVLAAIFQPVISPYPPLKTNYDAQLVAPGWANLLGTDDFGRDVLSRLLLGTRQALYVGVLSVVIGVTAGSLLGLISAYRGGWVDMVSQRIMDGLLSFPVLILALAIVAMLGPSDINVITAIAIVNVPTANRMLRSVTLSAKEEPYVESARAVGCSDSRLLFRHILPNVVAPYIVVATGQLAWAIIVASSLSFLGVASPPPEPTWGGMLAEGVQHYAEKAPWLAIAPAVFLAVAIFSFNLLGDAMRDLLDPRLRGQ